MGIQENKIYRLIKLLKKALGKYKYKVLGVTTLSFISGIFEGVGINSIIPLFSFVDKDRGAPTDSISAVIASFFGAIHIPYTLKYLLIFIGILFILKATFLFVSQYITMRVLLEYERDTRSNLLKLTLGSNWSYLLKQKVGYLDQTLLTDIDRSSGILFHVGLLIFLITNLIIYSLLVVNISPPIALLALLFGVIVFFVFKPLFDKNRVASGIIAKMYKKIAHFVNQNTIGMKTIKSMSVETVMWEKGIEFFEEMRKQRARVEFLRIITIIIMQPVALFFILGVFAFFYKTTLFNFASFAVIVYAVNRIFLNIQSIQGEIHDLNSRLPHLINIINYESEASNAEEKDKGTQKFIFKKDLEFQDISFSYGEKKILSKINFSVKHGEMIGLVGPSGGGKTTIVDLLLRLLEPQMGAIVMDGKDINKIELADWRTHVGYVSQDVFLINDTIANNIKFYSDAIDDKTMREAARMASIDEFIMKQSEKFNTVVGERGLQLSGGQRQRIALARVLARKPSLLILDEATSALDNESEVLIQKSIEGLRRKITVIAIAHRLSTVSNFDHLIVLEEGSIVEEGTPEELLSNAESYFSRMYNMKKS